MSQNNIIPIIMCGGTGTRLWPMSRQSFPKQYFNVKKDSKFSLLQNTVMRVLELENISRPILICNDEHRFIVRDQLTQIDVKSDAIILEPFGKNTCPAIAIAALKSIENGENPNLLVLAADHDIKNKEEFLNTIKNATEFSNNDLLVLFGIVPRSPETGYGYIEIDKNYEESDLKAFPIKSFKEKPNKETALDFLKQKSFLWNSGMFLFRAKKIIDEIKKFSPNLLYSCTESLKQSKKDLDFIRLNESFFKECPDISIDKAVMEKSKTAVVISLDVGWSDIGSWNSVWEIEEKDSKNNVKIGKVHLKDSKGCYARSEKRLVVGIGLNNLIVIETDDAILIANKENDQDIKNIINELEKKNYFEAKFHKKVFRPWGNYLSIAEGPNWQVKRIEVNVGGSLSLQLHKHRSEHWINVKGKALLEIDNKKFVLEENQSTYIPLKSKHRLSNFGEKTLVIIEVQSGDYLGEDDIVRFKDIYGR